MSKSKLSFKFNERLKKCIIKSMDGQENYF